MPNFIRMGEDHKIRRERFLKIPLSHERLLEVLSYDPLSGNFYRLSKKKGSKKGFVGYKREDGYLQICVDYKTFLAHRLAYFYMTGEWPSETIDHKNLIKYDNRWENLRSASYKENNFNIATLPNNTTGYKGVSRATHGGFRATISVDNKQEHIGTFETAELAYEAYCNRAKELHGEFIRLE